MMLGIVISAMAMPEKVQTRVVSITAAAKNAKLIHLGLRTDATAHAADLHVPAAHYLESWSDARTALGELSVVQPLILPLYNGVSELDLLLAFLDGTLFDSAKDGETTSVSYDAMRNRYGLTD